MYTNNKGFGLKDLIIKIIFVALFILLLIWLFRNYSPNMKPFYSNVFRENISYMQDAAKSYFTNDQLPTEVGKTVRLTLKQMEEMKLLVPFVDKDGKSCDVNKSYADVTKEEVGYTLKVNLVCGDESDYIIEILGCHDYCNNCNVSKTALEYEFKRTVKKDETVWSCPTGYTRNGKICSKKTGSETIAAISNYTEEKTEVSDVLYTTGESQKVEVETIKETTTKVTKQYVPVTIKETKEKQYTPRNEGTKTVKSYYSEGNIVTESQRKVYTNSEPVTETTCRDVRIKDPNCSVQCKWVTGSDGIPREVCNTCGYVIHRECTDSTAYICPNNYTEEGSGSSLKCYRIVTDKTYSCPSDYPLEEGTGSSLKCYKNVQEPTYSCPSGYTEEGTGANLKCYKNVTKTTYSCGEGLIKEGNGTNTKCYKNVETTTTTYSCPKGTTTNGKTGTALKCYKTVAGEKIPYCSNPSAKIQNNKCVLVIPRRFSHYSCKDGYTLNKVNGTCSKDIFDTKNATSSTVTKDVTETKWSREKTLEGWTPTGRTRTVKVK